MGAGAGTAAGAAASACAASLAGLDPLVSKAALVQGCPKLPKPDQDCASAASVKAAGDAWEGATSGDTDIMEKAAEIAEAGISAFAEYQDCKDGQGGSSGGSDPTRSLKPPRKFIDDLLKSGRITRKQADCMKRGCHEIKDDYGLRTDDDIKIDADGNVIVVVTPGRPVGGNLFAECT